MVKKIILLASLAVAMIAPQSLKADEGMWLPMFIKRLNYVDMQKQGLQLTPEEIYSINNSSLKDAVPIFGGGCTSELVSKNGLVLTNHHCGFSAIAGLSTTEHDYLRDGFWAKSTDEELPAPGLSVQFFVRMEDVTNKIQEVITANMTEDERYESIQTLARKIEKEASENGKYSAQVKSFYKGNEYYLFVYQIYKDVRLVGTPPQSIGKFGGETDNWMWPRHTCDFSMFRIYADKDNNPAEYSKENVPFHPKKYLSVNIGEKTEGDFAFIMGFPGTTQRYLTSWGIDYLVNTEYPAFVDARAKKLDIMREAMAQDQATRINYSNTFASTSNYWKNRIGMIDALTKNKTADKKREIEAQVQKWIDGDSARRQLYGDIFAVMQKYYSSTADADAAMQYLSQAGLSGSQLAGVARSIAMVLNNDKMPAEAKKQYIPTKELYSRLNIETEKELSAELMKHIVANVPDSLLPSVLKDEIKKAGNVNLLAEKMKKSVVFTPDDFIKMAKENPKALNDDILIKINLSYADKYMELRKKMSVIQNDFNRADRLFHYALIKAFDGKKVFYPDANFTMRVTYGQILPYDPKDGVTYHYETTLKGVAQKYKKGDVEFDAPEKLLDLYAKKDFGRYANSKGELVTCFLSNLDITGGNSGSPIMNGRGELIGIAFDGNWEAMSGDIEFEPTLQRTISVDIRYVMFIIDKFAGAQNIIDEMTIIDTPSAAKAKDVKTSKKNRK
ncbi:MAG: S46 family peptidase [Flavobacteriales bacterium]|nr:S46 family peptidase [Flavobacteriales bacterium]